MIKLSSAAFETVEQGVYRRLRDEIVALELPPGRQLQLEALSVRLGVSLTPIRHALRRLASDGLVETTPRRGSRVALLEPAEVEEIQLIRLGVEPRLAELACARMEDEAAARLEELLEDVRAAYAREDVQSYMTLQWTLRETAYEQACRPRLERLVAQQRQRYDRYLRFLCRDISAFTESLAHQEDFVAAARERDGSAAAASTAAALAWSMERLLAMLPPS